MFVKACAFAMVLLFCVFFMVLIYATYFVTQVFSRNILNFNIWAQKKRHPPARMPPKTNEKHKSL